MFKEMRKIDKEMNHIEIVKMLRETDYGILSIVQDNSYPYGIPLNYAYFNEHIYFLSENEGNKKESIHNNDRVSFTVVDFHEQSLDKDYNSVVTFGRAVEIFGHEKLEATRLLVRKYSNKFNAFYKLGREELIGPMKSVSVFKVKIDFKTGKFAK